MSHKSSAETSAAQGVPAPEPRGDSSGSMQDGAGGADAQLNLLKAEAIALRESGDKIGALAKVRQIRALKAQQQADERQMALELAHMTGLVWARGLLANPEERRKVSDTEFRRQDEDNNGVLDKSEAFTVVERMCTKFGLALPKKEKISELFSLCDKNGDGVIQIAEFRNYFRVVLESCVGKAESELAARYHVEPGVVAALTPLAAGTLKSAAEGLTIGVPMTFPRKDVSPAATSMRSTPPSSSKGSTPPSSSKGGSSRNQGESSSSAASSKPSKAVSSKASPLEKLHAMRLTAGSPTSASEVAPGSPTTPNTQQSSASGGKGFLEPQTPFDNGGSRATASSLEILMVEQRLATPLGPKPGPSLSAAAPSALSATPPAAPSAFLETPPAAPPLDAQPVTATRSFPKPQSTMSFREVAQLKGIEWARALLASAEVRRALCNAEFSAADRFQNGALDRAEALECVKRTCERFEVRLPSADKCGAFYDACDTSRDGSIQPNEVRCAPSDCVARPLCMYPLPSPCAFIYPRPCHISSPSYFPSNHPFHPRPLRLAAVLRLLRHAARGVRKSGGRPSG